MAGSLKAAMVEASQMARRRYGNLLWDMYESRTHSVADQIVSLSQPEKKLISMARGCDIPIYEHCYLAGLVDGMHLKETLEQIKTP